MAQGRKHKTAAQVRYDAENKESTILAPSKPNKSCPHAPDWLAKEGKIEWRRIVKPLKDCGLLDSVDRVALSMYCASWAIYVESVSQVAKEGCTVPDKDGLLRPHPAFRVATQALKDCMSIASQLGLTANARLRMGTALTPPEKDASVKKKKDLGDYIDKARLKIG